MSSVFSTLTKDNILDLLQKLDTLSGFLNNVVLDENFISAVNDLKTLLIDLQKMGLFDTIKGIVEDENTLKNVIGAVVNDGVLNIMSNWSKIMEDLAKLDLTNLRNYVMLNNAVGSAIRDKEIKPIKGVWSVMKLLNDPDFAKGLGIIAETVKSVGRANLTQLA